MLRYSIFNRLYRLILEEKLGGVEFFWVMLISNSQSVREFNEMQLGGCGSNPSTALITFSMYQSSEIFFFFFSLRNLANAIIIGGATKSPE